MRAFIVADDASAALRAQAVLATQNFICDTAGLDEDGVAIGKLYDHDIILLDLSAQIGVGCELVRQFRAAGVRNPIWSSRRPIANRPQGQVPRSWRR